MTWILASLHAAAVLWVVISILRGRRDPTAMLAWIMTAALVPLIGAGAYAIIGTNRAYRIARRKRAKIADKIARVSQAAEQRAAEAGAAGFRALDPDLTPIADLANRLTRIPAVGGNEVRVYADADATFAALAYEIDAAEHHIHMQYYIWKPDETGKLFRDRLIRKARAGVECRVLLDAVGCIGLPRRFLTPMIDAGVDVAFFMPLWPLRKRWGPNLRNHRKIAVIDGRTGVVGSQNIGDEYRGRLKRLSPWYDCQLRIRGPAVLFLQETFAEDWLFATRQQLNDEPYMPEPKWSGDSVVQILATGPDQKVSALNQVVFSAVSTAHRSIRIATPYFVPDAALRMALIHAACRGVRVELVLPTRSDSPLVLWAGRSFYDELLENGIEIYEFDRGMLHSKIITVDDRWCMLGSANMDIRSFRLNFEVTALVYDVGVALELARLVESYVADSRRIVRSVRERRMGREVLEGAARLFSPLL